MILNKLTTEELSCEQDYKRLIYTRTLQMLNNQRKKLDEVLVSGMKIL